MRYRMRAWSHSILPATYNSQSARSSRLAGQDRTGHVNSLKVSFYTMPNRQTIARRTNGTTAWAMTIGVAALSAAFSLLAQDSAAQERLSAVKQAMAANAQQLRKYRWIETTQVTLNGEQKPATQNTCQYGPDGQVQKTPLGPPPQPPSGGPLMKRIIEKKQAEMKQYMGEVKSLLALYLPPDPQKMQQSKQAGNLSINPVANTLNLVFKNYVQSGDQLSLSFDTAAKKISSVNIDTFMGDTRDAVTLQVQMASLPDGTNYAQQTILNATAKNLLVVTSNSNYQILGGS